MRRLSFTLRIASLLLLSSAAGAAVPDSDGDTKNPPLSPAQIALFETPHLKTIDHPETLQYHYERIGIEPLVDTVTIHIEKINSDGTKYVSFDFLTGDHRQFYPAVDNFSGNPLLMMFLEHDVQEMKQQVGVAAAYFRDHIRAAFIDKARIADTSFDLDGKHQPARLITLKPFADDDRFDKLPMVKGKTYSFILSDALPGQIEALKTESPADPESHSPAWSESITFTGVAP
jgi:hypothetical protein